MYVYALLDPRDNQIRYIGKTNDLKVRLKYHIGHRKTKRTYLSNWLSELIESGYAPVMEILEDNLSEKDAYHREKYWIEYGHSNGWRLTNLTEGGEGSPGYKWTEEQKNNFSQKKRGHKFTDEHRAALSFSQKERLERGESHVRRGMKHKPESIERIRQSHLGKPMNVDHKQRSADRAKEWADPIIRAKRLAGMKIARERKKNESPDNPQ